MITLLKDLECYSPKYIGKKDILIAGEKIYKITEPGREFDRGVVENQICCGGLLAFPGILDQHVHITGGGGEQGFQSRISEIKIEEILLAGVTTLVGTLGADGYTRSMEGLLAKAKALEIQSITTFIYSGSYALPPVTLTGSIVRDLILIDKVIGAGEIAISDHRSSQPTLTDLARVASQAHIGGLLGSKAGVMHLHVGDGRAGLAPMLELLEKTDLPMEQFVPTHLNRSPSLFKQAENYCRRGGNTDLTAGEENGIPVPDAVEFLFKSGLTMSKVTISSDSNGSSSGGKAGKIGALYEDIKNSVLNKGIPVEKVFSLVTENVARVLKLYPKKGALREGSDADILITDRMLNVEKLFCRGQMMVDNGEVAINTKNTHGEDSRCKTV